MIIQDAAIAMSSQREALVTTSRQESFHYWQGSPPTPTASETGQAGQAGQAGQDSVSLSDLAKQAQSNGNALTSNGSSKDQLIFELVRQMVKMLLGHEIKMPSLQDLLNYLNGNGVNPDTAPTDTPPGTDPAGQKADAAGQKADAAAAAPAQGWGATYDATTTRLEQEQTVFAATGKVTTRDGQEVQFSIKLAMSRAFIETNAVHLQAGDAKQLKDPLVINFDGTAAQLSSSQFSFDLSGKGQGGSISFFQSNSAFLALDKNKNGTIDNGTELFGPATGQGFAELAQHDADHNQWIDEKDPIYSDLRLWNKDGQGNDQLATLKDKGIGAIYLGQLATPFSLKDGQNQTLGQVRSSGFYLKEQGGAGTIQQVDLAV